MDTTKTGAEASQRNSEGPKSSSDGGQPNGKPQGSEKKELTGAQKKAAAKSEKAARRAAQKVDGPTSTPVPKKEGPSEKQAQPKQSQGKHQHQDTQPQHRRQSSTGKTTQQQLPTRTRRPSNNAATTTASATRVKTQKSKQLNFLSHLYAARRRPTQQQRLYPPSHRDIHPSVQTLALHLESYKLCGSQARTIGLLLALKAVIRSYTTPDATSLPRHLSSQGLSAQLNHVKSHGRPFGTAQSNAVRWLKNQIATLDPSLAETTAINSICTAVDEFIREKFIIADRVIAQAVAGTSESHGVLEDGDDVLVFGKSAGVCASLREAAVQGKRFSVTCVDAGRPLWEGKTMAKSLAKLKVKEDLFSMREEEATETNPVPPRTRGGVTALAYVPLSQLHAHLSQSPVSKVFLGANSIFSNGSVLSRAGQAQVALAVRTECQTARIYVLAESLKCTERAVLGTSSPSVAELAPESELMPAVPEHVPQGDSSKNENASSFEKGDDADQDQPLGHSLSKWQETDNLYLMNLMHDVTPPELIDGVVTEIGTVPPSAAAAVGRIVGVGSELGEV